MSSALVSPSGKTLIPVARRTTTPTPANAPKPVPVEREYLEVLIFDKLPRPASAFGHAAIGIDGTVYSRAHEKYFKGSLTEYLRSNTQGVKRDVVGLYLWVSPRERRIVQDELERRVVEDEKYSVFSNSCSSNVADVLELVGIMAHDPRYFPTPVSPADLLAVLSKSNRLVERRFYGKGYEGGASGNW
ncbi:DUF4105 domain-containing protein [Cupriavidus necator H16]|uniref:DUF4105 domain-containing protein n=1 Tax=Cupriavidus necator (strain ATCC 17699 / DSM 428 / KCTC 22496 / NCIMB 10442 / H16 / Stanier 337) TaxID=381666 RepID=Q0K6U1_CUPNH|nr:hypothetical protein [Cupriavidus necator]QCC02039.1 hypothetical protein E6A55_16330 [Cupriavidus necator H16]QQB75129.1 hypothetical protein I6H87_09820 [Cupriavidus necator]WKA40442.1 hypothetical protein QWP09_16360 [Cupriavidus necator]CAJ94280.1 Hypothetical protein H16_A3205 [Cupriavidus necator H16]